MSAQYISWLCIETTFEKYDTFHLGPLEKIMFEIYIHVRFPRLGQAHHLLGSERMTKLQRDGGVWILTCFFNILQWEALLKASLPKCRVRALEVGGSRSHEMISPTFWT